jgi:hypothetical protein
VSSSLLRHGVPLPLDAHALTIFRVLANGEGRNYTATTFPGDPYKGCERFVRMCFAVGWIKDESSVPEPYGVLDVLDKDWNIIFDYAIPTARAFQGIKRKLSLTVERDDG